MDKTQIGFIHTYNKNNGYGNYIVTEEIIGIFYKAGLGSTTYSDSDWNDTNKVKEELDKFYQTLRTCSSRNTLNINIITYSESEWLKKIK